MNENHEILISKLGHLLLIRDGLIYTTSKITNILGSVSEKTELSLNPDDKEVIAAFVSRFSIYQEQLGKAMRLIAIEENVEPEPFTAVLLYMEKIGILDQIEIWRDVRNLRNAANHQYEPDTKKLQEILSSMALRTAWLVDAHNRIATFVEQFYREADTEIDVCARCRRSECVCKNS